MNLKIISNLILASSVFLCVATYAETMTFKNKRGSILELNKGAANKIDGYFITAVASKSCPEAINEKRPITGYLIGNALTFSVVYPNCDSVLSVSGNFTKNNKAIDTISILTKQANDITHEGPGARFIGHDFYKIEQR